MRFRMAGVGVILLTAVTAGCSSPSTTPSQDASATADAAVGDNPATTASPAATITGTVDTNLSGCDATAKPGDCWLPLYSGPSFQGTVVLNATTKPTDDHCQVKGDESGCWPQPGDKVKVLCTAIGGDGLAYYGIDVPAEKQLTQDPDNTKKDGLGGVIGYNRTQWVTLPSYAAAPPSCGSI